MLMRRMSSLSQPRVSEMLDRFPGQHQAYDTGFEIVKVYDNEDGKSKQPLPHQAQPETVYFHLQQKHGWSFCSVSIEDYLLSCLESDNDPAEDDALSVLIENCVRESRKRYHKRPYDQDLRNLVPETDYQKGFKLWQWVAACLICDSFNSFATTTQSSSSLSLTKPIDDCSETDLYDPKKHEAKQQMVMMQPSYPQQQQGYYDMDITDSNCWESFLSYVFCWGSDRSSNRAYSPAGVAA